MSDPQHSVVLPVLYIHLLECLRSSLACCRWNYITKLPFFKVQSLIDQLHLHVQICAEYSNVLSLTAHMFIIQSKVAKTPPTACTAVFILKQTLHLGGV